MAQGESSTNTLLLIGAGIAAWYFFTHKTAAPESVVTALPSDDNTVVGPNILRRPGYRLPPSGVMMSEPQIFRKGTPRTIVIGPGQSLPTAPSGWQWIADNPAGMTAYNSYTLTRL